MAVVRLTSTAQMDFDEIVAHLRREASARVAARVGRQIQAKINSLVDLPGLGAPRSEYGEDTRLLVVDPYVVFYDGGPASAEVIVLRILHGHRRITPELIAGAR